MAENSFGNKCVILAELWLGYREDPQFEDFVSYNDIGLPLAFLIDEELVKPSQLAKEMVNETYSLLLASLGRDDDDHESLEDLLTE